MFTTEEIENIISLIQSPVAENVRLAFAMLEGKEMPVVVVNLLKDYRELYEWYYIYDLSQDIEKICLTINQEEELWLDDSMTTHIPSAIYLLKNLKTFDTGELYPILPYTFDQLANLQTFALRYTQSKRYEQCKAVPEVIKYLKNLLTLDVSVNMIEELPAWIGELRNLETLTLSDNVIQKIPESIGDLKNLQKLYSNYNLLKTIPISLANCSKLTTLDLSNNHFSETEKKRIKGQFSYVKELIL